MSVRERASRTGPPWPGPLAGASTSRRSRRRGPPLAGTSPWRGRNHSPSALYCQVLTRTQRGHSAPSSTVTSPWRSLGRAGPVTSQADGAADPSLTSPSDRAASTARRLGIGGQQQQQRPFDPSGEPLSARSASTRPTSRGRTPHGSAAPPAQRQPPEQYVGGGHAHVEPWLADHEFFEELGSKVREAKLYISRHGPEQARRATADLSDGALHSVDHARIHMQTPNVALEAVLLAPAHGGGAAQHHAAADGLAAMDSADGCARDEGLCGESV